MVATTNAKALAMGNTTDRDGGTTRKRRSARSRGTNTSHACDEYEPALATRISFEIVKWRKDISFSSREETMISLSLILEV